MKRLSHKGFTLIELLVVIAIIGILSSIVLSSLNTARSKGADAKVKSQLAGFRSAAEVYYDNNGNYGTATDDCSGDFFGDSASGIADLANQSNYPAGATLSCHTDGTAYAVSALLTAASSTGAWCVDSTGASKAVSDNLSTGQVVCP